MWSSCGPTRAARYDLRACLACDIRATESELFAARACLQSAIQMLMAHIPHSPHGASPVANRLLACSTALLDSLFVVSQRKALTSFAPAGDLGSAGGSGVAGGAGSAAAGSSRGQSSPPVSPPGSPTSPRKPRSIKLAPTRVVVRARTEAAAAAAAEAEPGTNWGPAGGVLG